jgi:hypothetical protein
MRQSRAPGFGYMSCHPHPDPIWNGSQTASPNGDAYPIMGNALTGLLQAAIKELKYFGRIFICVHLAALEGKACNAPVVGTSIARATVSAADTLVGEVHPSAVLMDLWDRLHGQSFVPETAGMLNAWPIWPSLDE